MEVVLNQDQIELIIMSVILFIIWSVVVNVTEISVSVWFKFSAMWFTIVWFMCFGYVYLINFLTSNFNIVIQG